MVSACKIGTPLLTSVPRVRVKREMATLLMTGPRTGMLSLDLVPDMAAEFGLNEQQEDNHQQHQDARRREDVILDDITDPQDEGCKPGQFEPHAGKDVLELGHDKAHEQDHDAHGHDQNGDGIKQRGLDLALDFLRLFREFGEPFEHDFEHTAQFAGLDHVDEQAVENFGMLRQRFGEGAAAFNGNGQFAQNVFQRDVAFLFFQHAQSAQQRQTGIHQRGQLAGEGRQHLRLHPPAETGDLDADVHGAALFAGFGFGGFAFGFFGGSLFLPCRPR